MEHIRRKNMNERETNRQQNQTGISATCGRIKFILFDIP